MSGSRSVRNKDAAVTAVQSGSAAVRLREARRFLEQFDPGAEVLLLGASRGSVDDLARAIALERGATFGLHRLSFTQLAARLAAIELASQERAPATAVGTRRLRRARPSRRAKMKRSTISPLSPTRRAFRGRWPVRCWT